MQWSIVPGCQMRLGLLSLFGWLFAPFGEVLMSFGWLFAPFGERLLRLLISLEVNFLKSRRKLDNDCTVLTSTMR